MTPQEEFTKAQALLKEAGYNLTVDLVASVSRAASTVGERNSDKPEQARYYQAQVESYLKLVTPQEKDKNLSQLILKATPAVTSVFNKINKRAQERGVYFLPGPCLSPSGFEEGWQMWPQVEEEEWIVSIEINMRKGNKANFYAGVMEDPAFWESKVFDMNTLYEVENAIKAIKKIDIEPVFTLFATLQHEYAQAELEYAQVAGEGLSH